MAIDPSLLLFFVAARPDRAGDAARREAAGGDGPSLWDDDRPAERSCSWWSTTQSADGRRDGEGAWPYDPAVAAAARGSGDRMKARPVAFIAEAHMATLRGNRLIILIGLALIGTSLLVATDGTFAQEKKKVSWSAKAENAKYTFQHSFEIPDISGHVLRLFELRSMWPDGVVPDGRESRSK
jgi:hypothetical protein